MIKPNSTMNDVINELMFIAIAQPEHLAIDISYHANSDFIRVAVLPRTFNIDQSTTTQQYSDALILSVNEKISSASTLKKLQQAKVALLELIENKGEVAA